MDEARRLIRYVIPGTLYAIETGLFLWLFMPKQTIEYLDGLKEDQGLGFAVAALLASGAIGYLLSSMHHWLYWHWPAWGGIDHRGFIKRLQNDGSLMILGHAPKSPLDAWMVVTGLWHERVGAHCPVVQAANSRAETLANLVHSAGTANVGYWCAIITTLALPVFCVDCPPLMSLKWSTFTGLGVVILLGCFHRGACRDTTLIAQHVVEQILTDAFENEGRVETNWHR